MRPAMRNGGDGPERVQDILSDFLKKEGVGEEVARAGAVDEWAERVGPKIAEVTRAR